MRWVALWLLAAPSCAVLINEPGWINGQLTNDIDTAGLGEVVLEMSTTLGSTTQFGNQVGTQLVFSSSGLKPSWYVEAARGTGECAGCVDDVPDDGVCKVTCKKVLRPVSDGLLAGKQTQMIMTKHNKWHTIHKCWWLSKAKDAEYGGQCICACDTNPCSPVQCATRTGCTKCFYCFTGDLSQASSTGHAKCTECAEGFEIKEGKEICTPKFVPIIVHNIVADLGEATLEYDMYMGDTMASMVMEEKAFYEGAIRNATNTSNVEITYTTQAEFTLANTSAEELLPSEREAMITAFVAAAGVNREDCYFEFLSDCESASTLLGQHLEGSILRNQVNGHLGTATTLQNLGSVLSGGAVTRRRLSELATVMSGGTVPRRRLYYDANNEWVCPCLMKVTLKSTEIEDAVLNERILAMDNPPFLNTYVDACNDESISNLITDDMDYSGDNISFSFHVNASMPTAEATVIVATEMRRAGNLGNCDDGNLVVDAERKNCFGDTMNDAFDLFINNTVLVLTPNIQVPTNVPTSSPTKSPTDAPTAQPTPLSCAPNNAGDAACSARDNNVCYDEEGVNDFSCSCETGYYCVDFCNNPQIANACVPMTSVPTDAPTSAPTPNAILVITGQQCGGGTTTEGISFGGSASTHSTCQDVILRNGVGNGRVGEFYEGSSQIHVDFGATCVLDSWPYNDYDGAMDIDYSDQVVIYGDVVRTETVGTYRIDYDCWPEALRSDSRYRMVTAGRNVYVVDQLPGSGCQNGGEALHGHPNIFLCPWGGYGLIYKQDNQCAAGFHVCTGTEVYSRNITWAQAHTHTGCYAYNAASDCGACYATCQQLQDATLPFSVNGNSGCHNTQSPDLAGIGANCADEDPTVNGCLDGGGSINAHADAGAGCYTNKNVGVACCPDSW